MRGKKINIVLALVAFLISFAAVEVGLRVYLVSRLGSGILWYGTRFNRKEIKGMYERERWAAAADPRSLRGDGDERHTVRRHEFEGAGYSKFRPNETKYTYDVDTDETIPVRINSHGFRGADYQIAKQPGVIRIVTLGASSTFGYHDRDDQTYPYYLEQMLQQGCGASVHFEVLNLGVPHLTSAEIVQLFRAEGLPLHPDVVTFYEGINDSSYDKPKIVSGWYGQLAAAYRSIREHVVVAAFVEEYLRSEARQFSRADVERHQRGRSERFLANLTTLHNDCRESGATLMVATQQATSLLLPRSALRGVTYAEEEALVEHKLALEGFVNTKELNFLTHRLLMRDLMSWTSANDVPVVDLIKALDQRRDVLVSWVHLTAEGNRMVARELSNAVRARFCPDVANSDRTEASGGFR